MGESSLLASFRQLPDALRFALLLTVGFMLFIIWDQWHWWQTREDYSFGFLVPMFVAYVIYDRWPKIMELATGRRVTPPAASAGDGGPEKSIELEAGIVAPDAVGFSWSRVASAAGYAVERNGVIVAEGLKEPTYVDRGLFSSTGYTYRVAARDEAGQVMWSEPLAVKTLSEGGILPPFVEALLKLGAYGMIAGGLLLFIFGAFYRAGAGPSNPGSLFIALGFGFALLPIIFLHTPVGLVGSAVAPGHWWQSIRQDRRVQIAMIFLFVAFIWVISAPLISVVENNLNLFLLSKVTYVVFFVFEMGGFPLEQQGNVLHLPNGTQVGVAEACSGIRSLTACLFAGSFLGAAFLNKLWKKVALIVAALCLAVFTNLLRSLFLTSWAYNFGADAIEGFVHDAAGYAVLGLTCVGLICLLPLFNLSLSFEIDSEESDGVGPDEGVGA